MKNSLILIAFLLLYACSFLASPPKVVVPVTLGKWSSSSPGVRVRESSTRESSTRESSVESPGVWWWTRYNDTLLNQLMESALQSNNQLQIAGANVDYASGLLKQIEFAWIPNISLLTGYSSFPAMGNLGYFYGGMASYSLNIFQQIKQQKQASYTLEAAKHARDSVELAVIGQVAASYFNLLAAKEQLSWFLKLKDDMQTVYALNAQRFSSGVSSEKEPYVSLADIAQIKAKIAIVNNNLVLSQNALRFLTNQNPGCINPSSNFSKINPNLLVPGLLPLAAINARPDVQEVSSQLQAANEGIGVAQTGLLPNISLASFYRDAAPGLAGSFSPADLNQLALSVPVVNAQVFAQIATSNASYKRVYYAYLQTILAALRDIDNDISAHEQYSLQLKDNQVALANIASSCRIEQSRYGSGVGNKLDYTQCLVKYDYLQLIVIQSKLAKMMASVLLYQDLAILKD